MHVAWELVEFWEVMSLLISVHYLRYQTLRHLEERFNINTEMRIICFVTFLMSVADYYEDNVAIYLIQTMRDLVVLFVSNFLPCLKSWDDSLELELTPDVINDFGLSIFHKVSLNCFSEFLQSADLKDLRDSSIDTEVDFAQACDAYLWFLISVTELEYRPTLKQARKIYKQYFKPSHRLFTKNVLEEVKANFNSCQEAGGHEKLIVSLFSPAKDYALEALQRIYYTKFMPSAHFERLKREVEMNLKRKQRDELHRLEGSD